MGTPRAGRSLEGPECLVSRTAPDEGSYPRCKRSANRDSTFGTTVLAHGAEDAIMEIGVPDTTRAVPTEAADTLVELGFVSRLYNRSVPPSTGFNSLSIPVIHVRNVKKVYCW